MSAQRPVAATFRSLASLTERLKAEAVPIYRLSATEERLLSVMRFIFMECVLCARINAADKTHEPLDRCPATEAVVAEGARLALAAAIEVEAPLREVRERMEVRR